MHMKGVPDNFREKKGDPKLYFLHCLFVYFFGAIFGILELMRFNSHTQVPNQLSCSLDC